MSIRCDTARERLAASAGAPRPWATELEGHLEACSACRSGTERLTDALRELTELPRLAAPSELEARVRAELAARGAGHRVITGLERLRRLSAPPDLDGRAVAAVHAGFREDRAVEQVRSLTRLSAPAELEFAIARALEQEREQVPSSAHGLDELRSEGARNLLSALVWHRAALRRRVPEELDARVEARLTRRPAARAASWLAAGALVAFALGWGLGSLPRPVAAILPGVARGEDAAAPDHLDFEVVYRSEPAASLAPMGQNLLGSLSGGLSEAVSVGAPPTPPDAPSPGRESLRPPQEAQGSDVLADGSEARSGGSSESLEATTSQPILALLAEAPSRICYTGRRRVRLADPLGSGAELVLRERVSSDGHGHFAIDPLEVVSAPPGSEANTSFFAVLQKAREGFFFRYRDFCIRDLDRFNAHYRTRVIAERVQVAERACVLLDVRRAEGAERSYEVAVDVETGLVMRYRELVASTGELLTSVEFERIELRPTIDPQVLSGGRSVWQELDATAGDPSDVGFSLHHPSFVPSGYALERSATRLDALDRRWVEFVYSDGAEQLFFLHGEPSPSGSSSGPMGGRVQVTRLGAWTVVEGEVQGTPIVAIGKIAAEDLLLFVQSAFH